MNITALAVAPRSGIVVLGFLLLAGVVWAHRHQHHAPPTEPRSAVPLHVRGVSKRIRDADVLTEVSLTLHPGHILGVLGPNGSGKSTLLRIVAGLESADTGDIVIFGHPVHASAPILRRVGFLLGRAAVLPHLTGRRNLELAWASTGRPRAEAHLEQILPDSGLGADLDRRAGQYSEGMRHSTGLALAMLSYPDILGLDEPTNSLDPLRVLQLREQLRTYADAGRSVLLTTHDLHEAELLCDDLLVLSQGRVALTRNCTDPRSSGHCLSVHTCDNIRAAVIAQTVAGVGPVEQVGEALRVRGSTAVVLEVLRAVHADGLVVSRVHTHTGLEQDYLSLLSAERQRPWSSPSSDGCTTGLPSRLSRWPP